MIRSVEERLAALETRDVTYREDMAEVKKDVREIRDAVLKVRGGWWVIITVFSLGSAIGALATKIFALVTAIPLPR